MRSVTVKDLIGGSGRRIGLLRSSAEAGMERRVSGIEVQRYRGAGWLDYGKSLIMTREDVDRLGAAPMVVQENLLQENISLRVPFVVLARVETLPPFLSDFSERHEIPFFCSSFDEFLLETRLIGLLREKLCRIITVHGVLIDSEGWGTLITGESGIGKTSCACALVGMGHRWVADDIVVMEKEEDDVLYGRGHDLTRNLLEIRGRGIVRADDVFRPGVVCERTAVAIIVAFGREHGGFTDATQGYCRIMGVRLPVMHMPVFQGLQRTAVCVDRTVRNFLRTRVLS